MIEALQKIRKGIDDYNKRNKDYKDTPLNQRILTEDEKYNLANIIRGLPEQQRAGIVNLLDPKEFRNEKGFYEINLGTLTTERQRIVEKYVNSCRKTAKDLIPIKYKEEFKEKNEVHLQIFKEINDNILEFEYKLNEVTKSSNNIYDNAFAEEIILNAINKAML